MSDNNYRRDEEETGDMFNARNDEINDKNTNLHHHKPSAVNSTRPFYRNIWFIFVSSLFTMSVCGSAYAFSSWSSTLKSQFNYTQSQLEIVGYLGNVGGWSGPICGVTATIFSSATNSGIAAAFVSIGYGIMAISVNIENNDSFLHSPVIMGIGNGFIMTGITFAYATIFHVNALNLPHSQLGRGLSALSMAFGLAATTFSALFTYVCGRNLSLFLVVAGILTATLCITNTLVLRRVDDNSEMPPLIDDSASSPNGVADDNVDGHATSFRSVMLELFWFFRQPLFWVYFLFMFLIDFHLNK